MWSGVEVGKLHLDHTPRWPPRITPWTALKLHQLLGRYPLVAQREAVADALRHATNRYRAGYSPYLEQIDAQRALLSVELAILQVRSDRLTAHVALYQALGGAPESEA